MATRSQRSFDRGSLPDLGPRVPPHNLEAEESVLGACLLSRDAVANTLEITQPDDFYKPAHVEIFDAILELYGRGEPVDAVTLGEELRRRDRLEDIGGKAYLHTLVAAVPTAGSAIHYAKIVEEHALLRRLIEASQEISDLAFSLPEDIEEAVDRAENLIYQVSQRRLSEDFHVLKDLLADNMEQVEKLYERGSAITGLPTGFAELDNITAGLQKSNLIIVAARPSQGKSSLAVSIAEHVGVNEQIPVIIFSLEMSEMELVQRLMCSEARVDSNRLRRGALQDSDWPKLSHALGRLAEAPLFIDDTPNVTIMEMRAKCRRLKSKHGLGLVIVDYLQLMQPTRRTDNRVQEVTEISRNLKLLAREMEVPVIAVSQLSRNVEYRADKRPLLADLRDSGCLTGESRVALAGGEAVPIADLVGKKPEVVTLNGWNLGTARASRVWKTGTKPVYKLTTATGRVVRATANHPFRTLGDWTRLDELSAGDRIALPRRYPEPSSPEEWPDEKVILLAHMIGDGSCLKNLPVRYASKSPENLKIVMEAAKFFGIKARHIVEPAARCEYVFLPSPVHNTHGVRNPVAAWLDELGLFDKRSKEKFVPNQIFRLSNEQIALFLRHLWATDGSVWVDPTRFRSNVYYSTSSPTLAQQVQHLLSRLGITSRITQTRKDGYSPNFQVSVQGKADQSLFADAVGGFGDRAPKVLALKEGLVSLSANTNCDTIPVGVWNLVRQRMREMGLSHREVARIRGAAYNGTAMFRFAPSRLVLNSYATLLEDEELKAVASSDVYWDRVTSIEPDGIEDVYDMTVPGTHNFVANGVVLHNSLEQDSDVVLFIYRDEVYNSDSPQKGIAEIHIAKHRNGPIGKIELAFLEHYTKFANLARGV